MALAGNIIVAEAAFNVPAGKYLPDKTIPIFCGVSRNSAKIKVTIKADKAEFIINPPMKRP